MSTTGRPGPSDVAELLRRPHGRGLRAEGRTPAAGEPAGERGSHDNNNNNNNNNNNVIR